MNKVAQRYQSFYEIVLSNSFDVTAIVDEQGIIKYKGPAITKVFGYRPNEMVGKSSSDFIHPSDLPKVERALEKLQSEDSGSLHIECRYLHKDGTYRDVEANVANELDNPHIRGLVINYRDITEKKRILEQMENQQRHLDLALKGADLGIWDWDLQTGEIFYNARWAEMLGYHLGEIDQEEGFWEGRIHEEDFERVTSALQDHINDKVPYYEEEYRLKTKNGGFRWILDRGKVMERNELGQPIRAAGTHLDITGKKQTEKRLHRKTHELMQSNKELEEFTYVTSHNLRSPAVNLKALLNHFNEDSINQQVDRELWKRIKKSADQLLGAINDISEIVALKKDLQAQSEHVQFEDIFSKVKYALEDDLNTSKAQIYTDFDQAPAITYPARHLESFFLNMLTNAIKYRKHGRKLIVDIQTRREQGFIVLEHADNGLGLDLNKYGDRLFKMHQRFHGKAEGNGLGLYIVKKQLESLQGMIKADSAPDEGMKFKLYLKDQEIVNE